MDLFTRWQTNRRLAAISTALFAAAVTLFLYRLTLVREVEMSDPAELALQAYQLGLTHPPGYPLHTLLGFILTRFFAEPAFATNLLSALCTGLAAGLLSLIIFQLTDNAPASLVAPLAFAASPQVWAMAIVTEVYNVNLFFFALSLLLFVLWINDDRPVLLAGAAAVFGLSLGTYLANLLMLPAFLAAIALKPDRLKNGLLFVAIVFGLGALIHSYTLFRAQTVVPMGVQAPPNTLPALLRHLAGEQYGVTAAHELQFYLTRPIEHARLFAEAFLYLGIPIGLIGWAALWRRHRAIALFTTLAFCFNWGFFTFYGPPDYYWMVMPSYLLFAVWMGCSLLARPNVRWLSPGLIGALALVALVLLARQYPDKRARAYSRHVSDFGLWSLSTFPPDAVVVSAWPRYTLLAYLQTTRGLRPDVLLIERESQARYYTFGLVEDYTRYIDSIITTRPVILDIDDPALTDRYRLAPINSSWYQVKPNS